VSNRWITRKRKSLGLTQHELARQSRVPFSRVSYAETGRIQLTTDELERIEGVFRNRARRIMDAVLVG
jgi:transcriptional regulator with XRE-family HTH domain